jgi:hypothetical protein
MKLTIFDIILHFILGWLVIFGSISLIAFLFSVYLHILTIENALQVLYIISIFGLCYFIGKWVKEYL